MEEWKKLREGNSVVPVDLKGKILGLLFVSGKKWRILRWDRSTLLAAAVLMGFDDRIIEGRVEVGRCNGTLCSTGGMTRLLQSSKLCES